MRKTTFRRTVAAVAASVLTLTSVLSAVGPFSHPAKVFAAGGVLNETFESADGDAYYNFDVAQAGYVTADKAAVDTAILHIPAGQYRINGGKHGIEVYDTTTMTLDVAGATRITLGACQYSEGSAEVTVTDADGSYTETLAMNTGACYHNDDEAVLVYTYPEHEATTLTITFSGKGYIPFMQVDALDKVYDLAGQAVPVPNGNNVEYGSLTLYDGFGTHFNDTKHGVQVGTGETFSIDVSGPTKIIIGDCQYSDGTDITATSADGSYSETESGVTGCWHNDGSAIVFTYDEEQPDRITFTTNKQYIPIIKLEAILEEKPDENGVVPGTFYDYNFSNGSVLETKYDGANQLNGTVVSADGHLRLTSAGTMYTHDTQHGLAILKGDQFDIDVSGDATITFHLCQYGTDTGSIVSSSKKGSIDVKKQVITDGRDDGLTTTSFHYTGVATTLTFKVDGVDGQEYYLHGVSVSNMPEGYDYTPVSFGNGKIDVWDFGGAVLDESVYNNKISVADLNALYPDGTTAGSTGNTVGSFDLDELVFRCGGRTNNRIRTANEEITRYDTRNPITVDGTELRGYLYSNNQSPTVYVGLMCYANDKITLYTSSNGGDSTIYFESPSGDIQVGQSNGSGVKLEFFPTECGEYKIYSTNEKLTLYRAVREHTQQVNIVGNIDKTKAEGIPEDYSIIFTNQSNGTETEVYPSEGGYETFLNAGFKYDVSLGNANGYVISSNTVLDLADDPTDHFDITIEAVDLVTVTGALAGLDEAALSNLELSFVNEEAVYVPDFTIEGNNITMYLERGVEYSIVADGINDWYLSDITTIKKTEDGTQDITFARKPVYSVAVTYDNLPDDGKANAIITFTNIDETDYSYTFTAAETPELRDGQYEVVVTGTGKVPYAQKVTANCKVDGAASSITVPFEKLTTWDFSKYNGNPGIETIDGENYYLGLALSGNIAENKIYLLVAGENTSQGVPAGKVQIPVKAGDLVTLNYCYCSNFNINGGEAIVTNSGSTSQIDTTTYTAEEDGVVEINGVGQTYFTSITVSAAAEYTPTLTVGVDKDFQTINDALAYAATMNRTEGQRVQIVIDPGNYEEMLRVDVPNVSLVNAAGADASIELTNSGVDIADTAVRITSYYGHGYDYYSMTNGCLYDEDVLAANLSNGYPSYHNPGSGTTDNSYWNATVVVYSEGFEAYGIIFENSFNQYISAKEAADKVVCWETGSKGVRPTTVGDTSVQNKSFVERAAAIAIVGDKAAFKNCKFVGRQDTLYGGVTTNAVFEDCSVYGGTDYIFGGMKAIFNKCDLVLNTSAASTDVAYITAAQQAGGRGYLMYDCTVTSTVPGVDTASETLSKPGFFGRPWAGNTSEVVFVNTTVETTDFPGFEGKSLIDPAGWNNSLGGPSPYMTEYATNELSGEDNTASRVDWSLVLTEPVLDNGETPITFAAFVGEEFVAELQEKGFLAEGEVEYEILEGADATITQGEDYKVRSSAPFYKFVRVDMDGETVDPANYEAYQGSTVVEFNADYLATLAEGEHIVEIISNDGYARTTITIKKATENVPEVPGDTTGDTTGNTTGDTTGNTGSTTGTPSTGDSAPMALYFFLLAGSLSAVCMVSKKRRAH